MVRTGGLLGGRFYCAFFWQTCSAGGRKSSSWRRSRHRSERSRFASVESRRVAVAGCVASNRRLGFGCLRKRRSHFPSTSLCAMLQLSAVPAMPRTSSSAIFSGFSAALKHHDDHLVLLGDFNARVGSCPGNRPDESDNDEWADVRGPCGFGECKNAGKELLSFLSLNQLTICNTWFTKRSQYLQTWQHPHTKRWHAIDFIVTHQRDRRLCRDCRVVCTADCGSDHRMVCLTLVLPHAYFSRQKSAPKRPRFDVSQLKPSPLMSAKEKEHALQLVKAFQASISCSLKATDCQDTIEDTWKSLSNSLLDAGREHLGYAHKRQPDWFDENRTVFLPLIKERRLLHQRWVESGQAEDYTKFKIARTEARAAVRRAKNHWLADVAKQAELGRTSCQGGFNDVFRAFGLCQFLV